MVSIWSYIANRTEKMTGKVKGELLTAALSQPNEPSQLDVTYSTRGGTANCNKAEQAANIKLHKA